MKRSTTFARYQQIAGDLSSKIASGEYKVGDRIFARSNIATQYKVSAETARRAITLLVDMGIVEAQRGSGCKIISIEKAERFRDQLKKHESITSLQKTIHTKVKKQIEFITDMEKDILAMQELYNNYQHMNPLLPMKMGIDADCKMLGKSIKELNLWQNTAATLVAIERSEELIVSPGPYAVLNLDDVIYFIGLEDSYERLRRYLYQQ